MSRLPTEEGSLKIVIQKISFVTWQEINCQKKNRPPALARKLFEEYFEVIMILRKCETSAHELPKR